MENSRELNISYHDDKMMMNSSYPYSSNFTQRVNGKVFHSWGNVLHYEINFVDRDSKNIFYALIKRT